MDQRLPGGDTGLRRRHGGRAEGRVGARHGAGGRPLQPHQVLRRGGRHRRRRDRPPPHLDQGRRHPQLPRAQLPPREHVLANLGPRPQEEAGNFFFFCLFPPHLLFIDTTIVKIVRSNSFTIHAYSCNSESIKRNCLGRFPTEEEKNK